MLVHFLGFFGAVKLFIITLSNGPDTLVNHDTRIWFGRLDAHLCASLALKSCINLEFCVKQTSSMLAECCDNQRVNNSANIVPYGNVAFQTDCFFFFLIIAA